MEAAHRTALAKGEVGIRERKPCPKLRDFVPRFQGAIHTAKPATLEYYAEKLRRLTEYGPLANATLCQIDEALIQEYVAKRKSEVSVASVNRELAVLRRGLRLAQEWRLIERVPRIRMLPGEKPRDFVLSPKQEELYLAAAPQPLRDAVLLCLDTGLRISETLGLTWKDIEFEEGYLTVRSGKSKNAARRVYLTDRATEMLQGRQGAHPLWAFPGRPLKRLSGEIRPFTVEAIDKQHNRLRRLLKMPEEFVIHSMRHTFGTRLGEAGIDAFTIKKVMGHSTVKVSERYIHPNEEASARAIAELQKRHRSTTISTTDSEPPSVSH
jgi:integrase